MCTFFVKKPSQQIKKEHFFTIIENNPQGFGFVYTTGTKLVIVKSAFPNAESMWKKFCDAEKHYPKSNFIGHGRIATGSNLNSDNTHPFLVNKSLSMVHNGILRQFPSTAQKSDTVQYIEQVLRKLPKNFTSSKAIMDMIGRDIVGSKFAFLSVDNKVHIVNRHNCVVDVETGVLFSNSNYLPTQWLDYGGTKVAKSKVYQLPSRSSKLDLEFDFHVDADKGEIEKQTSDWEMCTDCNDYVRKSNFDYDWGVCKDCVQEFTNYNNSFSGKDENLKYCEDCGINVASTPYENWMLCDCCVHMYKDMDSKII
jgi:hypothetical protein